MIAYRRRPRGAALLAATAASAVMVLPAAALGQGTTTTAPTTGTTTTPGTTTTAPTGTPQLTALAVQRSVTAQKGHARFLVGVTLSAPAKLTVIVSSNTDGNPVRTIAGDTVEAAGRANVLVDAIDDQGFQLPGGSYKVRVQAVSEAGATSQPVSADMTLKLTRARGILDAITVPAWSALARPLKVTPNSGQIVAVVKPKGMAVQAGLRRGDVITKLNGVDVTTEGAMQVALRALPADRPVRVEFLRGTEARFGIMKPLPDWTAPPDWTKSLAIARQREPKVFAWAVAQAQERIDAGETEDAADLIAEWPKGWQKSAPGELLQGDILQAADKHKQALSAASRARARDRGLAPAWFNRGIALAGLKKPVEAAVEFQKAATLDPKDPAAPAFRSYVLSRADQTDEAIAAAQAAVAIDPRYADGHIPLGIALLAKGETAPGLKALRQGLLLLDDPDRAEALIEEYLDPVGR